MHPLVELRSMQDLISPQCVPNVVIALGGHPKHVMHPCSGKCFTAGGLLGTISWSARRIQKRSKPELVMSLWIDGQGVGTR